jgi:hypothetical protein
MTVRSRVALTTLDRPRVSKAAEIRTAAPINDDAIAHLHDGQPYRSNTANPQLTAFLARRALSTLPHPRYCRWYRMPAGAEIYRSMSLALLRSVWVAAPATRRQSGSEISDHTGRIDPKSGLTSSASSMLTRRSCIAGAEANGHDLSKIPLLVSARESGFECHTLA